MRAALLLAAACGSAAEPRSNGAGDIQVVVDSLPATGAGGVWVTAPNGTRSYFLAHPGLNLIASDVAFGDYRLEFDTVKFGDTGVNEITLRYDGSRWVASPIVLSVRLDRAHPDSSAHIVYRKVTGGIKVIATGNPDFWVEFLRADGSGCRCTAGGGSGLYEHGTATVQDLLPGTYQVHFLPITYFISPHTTAPPRTVTPSPSTVIVTVRANELAAASTVYTQQ
jgi:hypothetical protein